MKKITDWPFNCMEILNLPHLGTKYLGYEISGAHQGLVLSAHSPYW